MFKSFKNIKISTLIIHLCLTLAYPIIKVVSSESNKLLIFTDSITIIAFLLIILGIFYSMSLKGDFDRTKYILYKIFAKINKKPEAFLDDEKQKREVSFNYPLFLGIIYLATAILITLTQF